MIDVRFKVIGEADVIRKLQQAPEAIRTNVTDELVAAGTEVVNAARAAAPVKRGVLRDAVHFNITSSPNGGMKLYVTPYSRGAYHAHLLERGVKFQTVKIYRKVYGNRLSRSKKVTASGRVVWRIPKSAGQGRRIRNSGTLMGERRHHVDPQPYFMPAVLSAGDIPARLQGAVNQAAAEVNG